MPRKRYNSAPKPKQSPSAAHRKSAEYLFQLRLNCKYLGIPDFAGEHRFHPTRRWRFDAAWPDIMFAVEIEGGIFSGGRHVRGQGFEDDMRKYGEAQSMGWEILRVSPNMIADGTAAHLMKMIYERRSGKAAIPAQGSISLTQ